MKDALFIEIVYTYVRKNSVDLFYKFNKIHGDTQRKNRYIQTVGNDGLFTFFITYDTFTQCFIECSYISNEKVKKFNILIDLKSQAQKTTIETGTLFSEYWHSVGSAIKPIKGFNYEEFDQHVCKNAIQWIFLNRK